MNFKITIQDDLYSEHDNLIDAQDEIFTLTNLLGFEVEDIKLLCDFTKNQDMSLDSRNVKSKGDIYGKCYC